jgi:transducin (beta)-like 1
VAIEETLYRGGIESGKKSKGLKSKDLSQEGESGDFTLLSPHTITAMTRDRPPIQLTVPAAAAAAAVKARLEAEAQLEADAKVAAVRPASEISASSVTSQPTQQSLEEQHQGYPHYAVSMNASHAAAAMGHLRSGGVLPAGAAAFAVQQQRVAEAQLAALQQQELANRRQAGDPTQVAAAALAFVAAQQHQQSKTSIGSKRKLNSYSDQGSSAEPSAASVALHLKNANSQAAVVAEAVARLEARGAHSRFESNGVSSGDATPMEVDEADKAHLMSSHQYINGLNSTDQNRPSSATLGVHQSKPSNGKEVSGELLTKVHQQQARQQSEETEQELTAIEREDLETEADPSEVLELNQHSSEVFMCAWNPVFTDLIATGSGDASARIWQMGGPDASFGCKAVRELSHGSDTSDRKNKDVTTLEWSADGTLLATGSYDGVARVWSRTGALVHTLSRHRGPIFSLKWNRSGNYLLSGSYDQTTIVWDVSGPTGQVVQQFNDHDAPALDVDWKDDITFASCSTDKRVLICRVGEDRPLRIYSGHLDEVNAVKWDPSGTLLASCSDDYTAKVWNVVSERTDPLYDFTDHKAEIYTLKW